MFLIFLVGINVRANIEILPDKWNDLSELNIGYVFKVYPKIDGIIFNVYMPDGVVVYEYGPNSRDRFLYLLRNNHRKSIKYGFIEKELAFPKENTVIYVNGVGNPVNFNYFKSHRREFSVPIESVPEKIPAKPENVQQPPVRQQEPQPLQQVQQEPQKEDSSSEGGGGGGILGSLLAIGIFWFAFKLVFGGGNKKSDSDKFYNNGAWFHDNHKPL